MSKRSRNPRGRKARASEAAQQDVAVLAPAAGPVSGLVLAASEDPSQTAQLRAIEAGWDEPLPE
jgi:hypothetical protein